MWILCLAEDSHEMSSLIFSERQWKSIYECCLLQSWLAFYGLIKLYFVKYNYLDENCILAYHEMTAKCQWNFNSQLTNKKWQEFNKPLCLACPLSLKRARPESLIKLKPPLPKKLYLYLASADPTTIGTTIDVTAKLFQFSTRKTDLFKFSKQSTILVYK